MDQKSADRIAVDYAHKVGAVEGYRQAIKNLKEISMLIEDKDGETEND